MRTVKIINASTVGSLCQWLLLRPQPTGFRLYPSVSICVKRSNELLSQLYTAHSRFFSGSTQSSSAHSAHESQLQASVYSECL